MLNSRNKKEREFTSIETRASRPSAAETMMNLALFQRAISGTKPAGIVTLSTVAAPSQETYSTSLPPAPFELKNKPKPENGREPGRRLSVITQVLGENAKPVVSSGQLSTASEQHHETP